MSQITFEVPEDTLGLHPVWPRQRTREAFDIDIVAVHGLGGDSFRTWTKGNRYNGVNWIHDLLPEALESQGAKARIMTFGYNANLFINPAGGRTASFARDLCSDLAGERTLTSTTGRPIIFICHSLGGIVVKSALNLAHSQACKYGDIIASTKGVIFLGCPHQGTANIAGLAGFITKVTNRAFLRQGSQSIDELRLWSQALLESAEAFKEIATGIRIYSFYETKYTYGVQVVDEGSTSIGVSHEVKGSLDGNHHDICKFGSANESNFKRVCLPILNMVKDIQEDQAARQQYRSPTLVDSMNDALRRAGLVPLPQGTRGFQVGDYYNGQQLQSPAAASAATLYELPQTVANSIMDQTWSVAFPYSYTSSPPSNNWPSPPSQPPGQGDGTFNSRNYFPYR